ncbi:hypothetical protein MIR68_001749 [Amoeboaphelidium protococcarum]|nr:hypothetical protein MIR68_001749 [Amoeboaphelidium protococcarum]
MQLSDQLCRDIVQRVIAQFIKISTDYDSVSKCALNTLTEAYINYMSELLRILKQRSELSGRIMVTKYDLEELLDKLSMQNEQSSRINATCGYVKCSSLAEMVILSKRRSVEKSFQPRIKLSGLKYNSSTVIKDIPQSQELDRLMVDDRPEPLPRYVLPFSPPYPARHLYKQTAIFQHKEQDVKKIRLDAAEQTAASQKNLKQLVQEIDRTVVNFFGKLNKQNFEGQLSIRLPVINFTNSH